MSDTSDTAPQPQQPAGPSLRVLNQYIKDLSFENPGSPDVGDRLRALVREVSSLK